jgi:adenine-specific DNA glycosylase
MSTHDFAALTARLVAWHAAHQRVLPWRDARAGERAAYPVWVSEIMLQQTRVETVDGYFRRWMERFPTVEALAAADLQEVLKAWEGLGYYARARNLHKAARLIVAEHGGLLPADRKMLLALPGIGEYTVGAILSIAYNQPEPILDGNIKRVLARLCDIDQPVNAPACCASCGGWRGPGRGGAGGCGGRLQRGADGTGRHALHAAKPALPALPASGRLPRRRAWNAGGAPCHAAA